MVRVRFAVVILMTLASSGRAQEKIRTLAKVRVTTPEYQLAGRLMALDSDSLRLELPGGQLRSLARRDIVTIERRSRHTGTGAAVLGVIGAIAAGGYIGRLSYRWCAGEDHCGRDAAGYALGAGAVAGAAGALTGAVFGFVIPGWKPIRNPDFVPARR
jgi:hypothetical protein